MTLLRKGLRKGAEKPKSLVANNYCCQHCERKNSNPKIIIDTLRQSKIKRQLMLIKKEN